MKIIIDTNALVYAAKQKVDLASLLLGRSILIPKQVVLELSSLEGKGADKAAARLALQQTEKFEKIDIGDEDVDSQIIKYAKREGVAVLTNDLELRKRCKKECIKVFYIRQRRIISTD